MVYQHDSPIDRNNRSSNNKFRARIIVSLSCITESAGPFFMECTAALDEATMKKALAYAVCGSNGNGSSEQGIVGQGYRM